MHNQDLANVLTDHVWFIYNLDHENSIQDKTVVMCYVSIMLCYIRWLGRRGDWWYSSCSSDHHFTTRHSLIDLQTKNFKA